MSELLILVAAWFLTYLVHSTVLGCCIFALLRSRWLAGTTEVRVALLRTAFYGALITATGQVGLGYAPLGSLATLGSTAPAAGPPPVYVARSSAQEPTGDTVASLLVADPLRRDRPSTDAAPDQRWGGLSARHGLPWSVAGYLVLGFVGSSWFVLASLRRLRRRLAGRREVTDHALVQDLVELSHQAGLARVPRLTSCEELAVPIAWGLMRPEISLPSCAKDRLSPTQLRAVLAHEIAHLARRDPLWATLRLGLTGILFLQPWQRWWNKELSLAAEQACDEWALKVTRNHHALASSLAEIAGWWQGGPALVGSASMTARPSHVAARVERLLSPPPGRRGAGFLARGAAGLAFGAAGMMPGVAGPAAPPMAPETEHRNTTPEATRGELASTPLSLLVEQVRQLDAELRLLNDELQVAHLSEEQRGRLQAIVERRNRVQRLVGLLVRAAATADASGGPAPDNRSTTRSVR